MHGDVIMCTIARMHQTRLVVMVCKIPGGGEDINLMIKGMMYFRVFFAIFSYFLIVICKSFNTSSGAV